MKLGIFGGTFDPLHIGHLIVAADAAAALALDRVIFIPTGTHPLKRSSVQAPGELRLEMVRSAIEGSELFAVDDRELERPGPSYTVETVTELAAEHRSAELFVLIGTDVLDEINEWRGLGELARLAHVTVMSRANVGEGEETDLIGVDFKHVGVTYVAISSSDIRRRINAGLPWRYLVPESVHRIISEYSLYAASEGRPTIGNR